MNIELNVWEDFLKIFLNLLVNVLKDFAGYPITDEIENTTSIINILLHQYHQ